MITNKFYPDLMETSRWKQQNGWRFHIGFYGESHVDGISNEVVSDIETIRFQCRFIDPLVEMEYQFQKALESVRHSKMHLGVPKVSSCQTHQPIYFDDCEGESYNQTYGFSFRLTYIECGTPREFLIFFMYYSYE